MKRMLHSRVADFTGLVHPKIKIIITIIRLSYYYYLFFSLTQSLLNNILALPSFIMGLNGA